MCVQVCGVPVCVCMCCVCVWYMCIYIHVCVVCMRVGVVLVSGVFLCRKLLQWEKMKLRAEGRGQEGAESQLFFSLAGSPLPPPHSPTVSFSLFKSQHNLPAPVCTLDINIIILLSKHLAQNQEKIPLPSLKPSLLTTVLYWSPLQGW